MPVLLSQGVTGSALVRSKTTDTCIHSADDSIDWSAIFEHYQSSRTATERNLKSCPIVYHGCEQQYQLSKRQIVEDYFQTCFFTESICHNNTMRYEITHRGITPNEMRVNSRSRITINHRLTCAPISLEPFLRFNVGSRNETVISVASINGTIWSTEDDLAHRKMGITLRTMNNPNLTTNEDLSTRMLEERWPYDLTMLPRVSSLDTEWEWGKIYDPAMAVDEKLQSPDGMLFLAVHRAGPAMYPHIVDDPLFSSHVPWEDTDGRFRFLPDQEATALGCLENFQYCIAGSQFCTSWGTLSERLGEVEEQLKKEQDTNSVEDLWISRMLTEELLVHEYFLQRAPFMFHNKNVPFTLPNPLELKWKAYTFDMSFAMDWTGEVKEWLLRGIEKAMLQVQHGALIDIKRKYFRAPYYQETFIGHETLCDRVLFADINYTNVHFVGFITSTASLAILCISSYFAK
jgi:hypothetical protein